MAERYTIANELGRGAIGRVYAARDRSSGAVVALKVLDPALFSEPDTNLAGRFLENARSAARLRHRNIVKHLDAGEAGGTVYVAMELLEGKSLRHALDERPLSIARAIRIFDDIASALAYAHEEGMVHRGVKPSNIIVLRSGVAKIGDFGLGQLGEAAVRYMSPEQVCGEPVDHRSDIFSLGAVFYEMLTRRAPFEGNSPGEIRQNILQAKPPLPSEVNPHVPGALDGLVLRMLARRPDERFANLRLLLRDLQRLEEGLGLGPGASTDTQEPTPAERSRGREVTQQTRLHPAAKREPTLGEAFHEPEARFMMDRGPLPERSSGSRGAIFTALAVVVAAVSIAFWYYSPDFSELRTLASRTLEAPTTATASSPSTAPSPVAEATNEPAKAEQESSGLAPTPVAEVIKEPSTAAVAEPSPPAQAESLPTREAEQPAVKISKPQPTAKLIIAVSPVGELYIDGKHHGTTPPITTFDLEPGMHRIEIRSGSWKPYLTYMTVQAGDLRRIRHDFAAKPIRPPR